MPMKLTATPAKITHINLRKEGPDDDQQEMADVKLSATAVPVDIVHHLMPGSVKPGAIPEDDGSHWRVAADLYDSDGHPKFLNMPALVFEAQFDGFRVRIGSREFKHSRLKKFSARLRDERRCDLEFSAAVSLRTGDADYLSALNQEVATVEFEAMQSNLFDAPPADASNAAEKPEVSIEKGGKVTPLRRPTTEGAEVGGGVLESDPLLEQAHELIADRNAREPGARITVSFLQRALKVGYNRSARLLEELERRAILERTEDSSGWRMVQHREHGGDFEALPNLAKMKAPDAIDAVQNVTDPAGLAWLKSTENRPTVVDAIERRIIAVNDKGDGNGNETK